MRAKQRDAILPIRRSRMKAQPRLESLETRQLMAASITLDTRSGVLSIVGTPGNDLVEVGFGKTTTENGEDQESAIDFKTIVIRLQSDKDATALTRTFKTDEVKSVRYDGQGGTDFLSNLTTKVSSWTTTTGGLVNTSLMVGSPGYNVPGGAGGVGVFQVGPSGQVNVDYLYRGAGYNGQFAIFSLAGMDAYKAGSSEFIHEAARRALSESTLGHVVIKADQEGAKFTANLPWEGSLNRGSYQGIHTVTMNPGDTFAAMLVPNGKVQTVYDSTTFAWDLRPLFSTPSANPYPAGTQYLGQVGDFDGHGSLFAFEDLRLDGGSDRDYNDMVFQITGARGLATPVSEVTDAARNFAATPIFQQQLAVYAGQREQADDIGSIAGLLTGGFKVGSSGQVGVSYDTDGCTTKGEVAVFSLQGMGALTPGTPEFLREAARRALTNSVLGHVVISDAFDSARGGPDYSGLNKVALTPGDSFGILSVGSGTVWSLYTGAISPTVPGITLSLPGADGSHGAGVKASDKSNGNAWVVDLEGTQISIVGATANIASSIPGTANLCVVSYLDLDDNGVANPADPSLGGIEMTVSGIDFSGRPVTRTVVSAADGCAEFEGLPAGMYRVSGVDKNGITLDGGSQVGTQGGSARDGAVSGIMLLPGSNAEGYALGRVAPAKIRGAVYGDVDRDRIFDQSEPGLAGVSVRLIGTDDRGSHIDVTQKTAEDGNYVFEGLRPGTYTLSEAKPTNWLDGRESIGTFLGQPQPIARNGRVGNDAFAGIMIRPGEEGYHYNFGEWTSAPGDVTYQTETDLQGSAGDDFVQIVLGTTSHQICVNGNWESIDATVPTIVSFDGLGGNDTVTIEGIPGSEAMTITPTLATLIAPNLRLEINGAASVAFHGGMGDRAFLYDSKGDDVYKATPTDRALDGPGYHASVSGVERVYVYATSGGNDTAALIDSAGDDTFKATPVDARMYAVTYYNYVRGFDRVMGQAGSGGNDSAYLYDSAGDDTLAADPSLVRLAGKGYDLLASCFGRVDAYSTAGGKDSAKLVGSAGDDRFYAGPIEGEMVGAGFEFHAIGFATVSGSGGAGGADRAYLTGTQADDTLSASSLQARLTGPGLDVTAHAFPWVMVSGGSCLGTDTASLADSAGNDVFESSPNSARLYGPGYSIRVENFTKISATSSAGGTDTANFKDSAGDDTLEAAPGRARLWGWGFDNAALGFASINVDGSAGGKDRAVLSDSAGDDTLNASGSTVTLSTAGASLKLTGFESVSATATRGKNRKLIAKIDFALELLGGWVS